MLAKVNRQFSKIEIWPQKWALGKNFGNLRALPPCSCKYLELKFYKPHPLLLLMMIVNVGKFSKRIAFR